MRLHTIVCLLMAAGCGRGAFSSSPGTASPSAPGSAAPSPSPTTTAVAAWALSFDGVDDFAEVQPQGAFQISGSLTIEAWIRPSDVSGETHIISNHQHGDNEGYVLMIVASRLEFRIYDGGMRAVGGAQGAFDLVPAQWYHVAGVFEGSNVIRVFVDGVSYDTTGFASTSISPYSGPVRIGAAAFENSSYFEGEIDEVRISDSERYSNTFTPPTSEFTADGNTIALWHIEEGTGQSTADSSGTGASASLGPNSAVQNEDPAWLGVEAIADR